MNSVPSDDEIDIEAAWRKSSEPVDDALIDRFIVGTLAELDRQPVETSGFYWTLAASVLVCLHLAIGTSWSSSFDWSAPLRERERIGNSLLVRRELIESLEAEWQMSPAQPNQSRIK